MKYARIAVDGATRWGIVRGHRVQLIDGSPYDGGQITETLHELADVRLLAPVTPSKIFCLGRNYQEHRAEMGYEHDGAPSVFIRGPRPSSGQVMTLCCLRSACPHTSSTRRAGDRQRQTGPVRQRRQRTELHLRLHLRQQRERTRSATG